MKKLVFTFTLFLALTTLAFGKAEKMKYEEEYLPKLKSAKTELTEKDSLIKIEKAKIEEVKGKITTSANDTKTVWSEIYTLVASDEQGVAAYRSDVETLDKEIKQFGALPAEELFKRKAELDDLEKKRATLAKDKRSLLTEFFNKLPEMDQKIKSIRSSIVVPYVTSYVVKTGDCLWNISGKKDIYDNPFKWTDIYKANKEVISKWQRKYNVTLKEGQQEADLIYPEQEFTIPR